MTFFTPINLELFAIINFYVIFCILFFVDFAILVLVTDNLMIVYENINSRARCEELWKCLGINGDLIIQGN